MSVNRVRAAVNCVALGLLLTAVLVLHTKSAAAGTLDASWIAPTTNTDGSRLTDLASYHLYYGTSSSPCQGASFVSVASPTSSPAANSTVSFRLTGLATGTVYFVAVSAVDTSGNPSACSPTASAAARSEFTASPTGTVNFGNVNLGSFTEQTYTVSNRAGGTVTGSASVPLPFTIVSGSPFSLSGAGATQAVKVRFTPPTNTTMSATISFTANGETITRVATGTGVGSDTTKPSIGITSPTSSASYTTGSASLALQGTASDNVGVTQVTWTNSRGGSGTATGTTSWSASGIALQSGSNVLTVTARDAAGNTAATTLTATYDNAVPTRARGKLNKPPKR
jgi:Big-like domain-containing protein